MNGNAKFDKYKRIKDRISYKYRGYPIENIVALDLIVHIYHKRYFTLKTALSFFFKSIIRNYFLSYNLNSLKKCESGVNFFSIGNYGRKDYYEILNFVKSKCDRSFTLDFSTLPKKYTFKLDNIIRAIKIVLNTSELSCYGKLVLASKISHYLNIIDELECFDLKVKSYCAFNSVLNYEALLANYFNKKEILTYTMQHAINPIYKKRIPFDAILYENFNTKYMLCWGSFTKNAYREYGIEEKSLLISGYPRTTKRPKRPSRLNQKECLILLSGYFYHQVNLKVLGMLDEFFKKQNIKVFLKGHPSLVSQNLWCTYKSIAEDKGWFVIPENETLIEAFESKSFGWSISVSSSSYFESFIYYIPCLRFRDKAFEDSVGVLEDSFGDILEFREKFNLIPFSDQEFLPQYFDKIDERLNFILGISSDNYEIYLK